MVALPKEQGKDPCVLGMGTTPDSLYFDLLNSRCCMILLSWPLSRLCFIYFDVWSLLSPPPIIIFFWLMMKYIKLIVYLPPGLIYLKETDSFIL